MRIVENVDASKLGRGDALIVAAEYKPLWDEDKYEKILPILDDLEYSDDFEYRMYFGLPMLIFEPLTHWWKKRNLRKGKNVNYKKV